MLRKVGDDLCTITNTPDGRMVEALRQQDSKSVVLILRYVQHVRTTGSMSIS